MLTTRTDRSVAVVGFAPSAAAPVLRCLLAEPVEELDPYDLVMGRGTESTYRAVVVENYRPQMGGLNPCAAARWAMPAAPLTVVSLDDPAGRSLVRQPDRLVFAYSDGRAQADLTAKNVNLRWGRLEFEALTDDGIARVCLNPGEYGLYGPLAALACALGLGMPLKEAVARLNASV